MRSVTLLVLPLFAAVASALLPSTAAAQVTPGSSGTSAEFRAIYAPSADVVWAAGQRGTYTRTTDRGATWLSDSIPGAADLFLTGVWSRDASTAIMLGTSFDGGAARIYRTDDGGRTWTQQWERTGEGVFFDALRCWDSVGLRCIAFSDPVAGAFLIVRSIDGRQWAEIPRDRIPQPLPGEAGFAASGNAMTSAGTRHAWIGTGGGSRARVYFTRDGGGSWDVSDTPLPGNETSGIFGLAFTDTLNGIAVGGDYSKPRELQQNVMRTQDGGRTWTLISASQPAGVRYGVTSAADNGDGPDLVVAPGPSGVGLSRDGGTTWIVLDTTHYNTATFTSAGDVFLAGPRGRIARIAASALRPAGESRSPVNQDGVGSVPDRIGIVPDRVGSVPDRVGASRDRVGAVRNRVTASVVPGRPTCGAATSPWAQDRP